MSWTHFMDMHSGGSQKEAYAHIYIEAPEEEAKIIFYNRFGDNPERVTCTCCGDDYSISEDESLDQLTAFNRNCAYDNTEHKWIEEPDTQYNGSKKKLIPLEAYIHQEDVLVIKADEIKSEERTGTIPQQGYVWID